MPVSFIDAESEEWRDLLLFMVYLDEKDFYKPYFTAQMIRKGMQRHGNLSQLLDWIEREGAAYAN